MGRGDTGGVRFAWSHVGKHIERLTNRYVDALKSLALGRRNRPFQKDARLSDNVPSF